MTIVLKDASASLLHRDRCLHTVLSQLLVCVSETFV
jgi:hypothetical protein